MKSFRLGFLCAAVLALSLPLVAQHPTVTFTITGRVLSGIDAAGIFGGVGPIAAGQPFTLIFTFDETKGENHNASAGSGPSSRLDGSGERSPGTATLQIGSSAPYKFAAGPNPTITSWAERKLESCCFYLAIGVRSGNNYVTSQLRWDLKSLPTVLERQTAWNSPLPQVQLSNNSTIAFMITNPGTGAPAVGSLTPERISEQGPAEPRIFFHNHDVTAQTQTVAVGEKIELSAKTPDGRLVHNGTWVVPGTTVGDYQVDDRQYPTFGKMFEPDFFVNPTKFYWTNGAEKSTYQFPPVATLRVVYKYAYGAVDTTFRVLRPSPVDVSVTVYPTSISHLRDCAANTPIDILVLGTKSGCEDNKPVVTPGIKFVPKVSEPPGYSGSLIWVQIVESSIYTKDGKACADPSGSLDETYPYELPPIVSDSPNIELDGLSSESYVLTARMYLLWSPGIPDSIVVPLGSIHWNWQGEATRGKDKVWQSIGPPAGKDAFKQDAIYPTWTENICNSKCNTQVCK